MSNTVTKSAKIVMIASAYIVFLLFPQIVGESVLSSCDRCIRSLLPSVFPVMVISRPLSRLLSFSGTDFSRRFSRFSGIPESCTDIFLVGLLCGYPIPAYAAAEKYRTGALSLHDASVCAALFSNPSPPFIILFVGNTVLGSTFYGVLLYASTAAFILIFSRFFFSKNEKSDPVCVIHENNSFSEDISSCAISMIGIFGCVIFFSVFADIAAYFCRLSGLSLFWQSVFSGAFEITRGLYFLKGSRLSLSFVLVPLFCSFGGLSVYFQCSSAVGKSGVSMKYYFPIKLCEAVFLTAVFLIIKQAFPK